MKRYHSFKKFSNYIKILSSNDIHQVLMDEAYDEWQKNRDRWSYSDFINNLDDLHRKAVLIGNLNYQVENGGFKQWDFNGYSEFIDEVLDIIKEFAEAKSEYHDIGMKVYNIVDEVREFLNTDAELCERAMSAYNKGNVDDFLMYANELGEIDFRTEEELLDCLQEDYSDEDMTEDELEEILEQELNFELRKIYNRIKDLCFELFDRFDNRYYEINEEFLDKFGQWLKYQMEEKLFHERLREFGQESFGEEEQF